MRYTWLFILSSLATGAIAFIAWYRYRINSLKRGKKNAAVIAHTSSIKQLPAYKKAVKRYYCLLAAAAICLAATLFSFTAIAARPTEIRASRNANKTRDIILCMDVSGSMYDYQNNILSHIKTIVDSMDGERLGITIFDSVAVNVLPLSDDYVAVNDTIENLRLNFEKFAYVSRGGVNGYSNIGEGVMGCINSFDILGDGHTQSIIFATDNIDGRLNPEYTLGQAVEYGRKYGISFYAMDVKPSGDGTDFGDVNFYQNISGRGSDDKWISTILDDIFEKEAVKVETARELIRRDTPEVLIIVGIISFTALMFVLWRLHL
ncbi:VWA domain-containing protein [Candidatus Saccharibacteria bacterium]|nr:VWA domain-containing protein [Candidatus Saccharibacteria bacterium]